MKGRTAVWTFMVLVLGGAWLAAGAPHAGQVPRSEALRAAAMYQDATAELDAACDTANPFVAVARIEARAELVAADPAAAARPAILAARDTPGDDPAAQLVLASQGQVGSVFGLAYDPARRHLYAAAYHRRGAPFGPGGPGAIYRIDPASGEVETWLTLLAGADRHDTKGDDAGGGEWVGRTGLGGLEIDEAGGEIFAANLYDGRIHRRCLPDGADLGSFRHGATEAPWYNRARLFGLAFAEGWLYHGVMDISNGPDRRGPTAHVYRSRPDGSELAEVLAFRLNDHRPSWLPGWAEGAPMLTDLALRADGGLVIALRNRALDAHAPTPSSAYGVLPLGQVVTAAVDAYGRFAVVDDITVEEPATMGGLARLPGLDAVIAPLRAQQGFTVDPAGGAIPGIVARLAWYDLSAGQPYRDEVLAVADDLGGPAATGDVEVLCRGGHALDPARVATATAESASGGTATIAASSSTPAPTIPAAAWSGPRAAARSIGWT